jgi:hypothetical protein
MALFPTKQVVTVSRASGELDIFGKRAGLDIFVMKCRAIEGSHITTDRSSKSAGATIVCELKLMFGNLADITYDDVLRYENEAKTVYEGRPKNIRIRRDFGGKAVLTEVLI